MMNRIALRLAARSQRRPLAPLVAVTTIGIVCVSLAEHDSVGRFTWFPSFFFDTSQKVRCSTLQCDVSDNYSEPKRFTDSLKYHRSLISEYKIRWDYNNPTSKTPTSMGWPKKVPTDQEVSMLEYDYKFAPPGPYKDELQFRLATYYVNHDVSRAFNLLQDLAVRGHTDAMCLFGIIWKDGNAVVANPRQAAVWFRRAAERGHMQACYEMGVALYTGEGVAEDEAQAVEFFETAASMGHAAAAYMLGDCLLDGVGCSRDRAEALEWLVASAEMGHRGARSRVMAVLEMSDAQDYGDFTDSSRQSFKRKIDDVEEEKKWSEEDLQRLVTVERKFTIGGGSRNPVVLARRKTVVKESLDEPDDKDEEEEEEESPKEKKEGDNQDQERALG